MLFVSERIVNIGELESALINMKINFDILNSELKKDAPSKEILNSASSQVVLMLDKVSGFEFLLEKRKCVIPESS